MVRNVKEIWNRPKNKNSGNIQIQIILKWSRMYTLRNSPECTDSGRVKNVRILECKKCENSLMEHKGENILNGP